MNGLKILASEKMLLEMNKKHTEVEDIIHNWICDQEDDLLFEGVLKEDRSIKGAVSYCMSQASRRKTGQMAMADSDTVFRWVKKYFTADKVSKQFVQGSMSTSSKPKTPPKQPKSIKQEEDNQIDLFEGMDV